MISADGTGGCDGCLNWKGVGADTPNPNVEEDFYQFPPANETDNNGLENLVMALEMIYTNIDWPFEVRTLSIGTFSRICVTGGKFVSQSPTAWQVSG